MILALKQSLSGKSSELEELAKKSAAEKARLVPIGCGGHGSVDAVPVKTLLPLR